MTPKELHDELKRLLALTHNEEMPMRIRGDASISIGEVAHENIKTVIRALSALSGLEGVKGADEWQPMAKAPKDGTWILAYSPDGTWARVSWGHNRSGELAWCSATYSWTYNKFTHWRPLLTPPARSALSQLDQLEAAGG